MRRLALLCHAGVLCLVGCSRPASTGQAPVPEHFGAQIVHVSGEKQLSGVGALLTDQVVVQVNGADGNAVAGALVTFHGSGLGFNPSRAFADSSGQVSTLVRLGSAPGNYQIVAETPKSGGGSSEVNISATALGYEEKLGKEMNDKYCIRCHDPESTTERVSNFDNLSPKPHPFSEGIALNALQDSDLTRIISRGGVAAGKSAQMPAWGATLKPAEIKALVAYIRAVADPPYRGGGVKNTK